MDRRKFLVAMSAAFGGQLIMPLQRLMHASAEIDPINFTGGSDLFFENEKDAVAALCETIIPTTDTPGAIAAGVPDYIEFMLSEWYDKEERTRFLVGIKQVVAYAQAQFRNAFAELDEADQTEIVQRMHDGRMPVMMDGGRAFFEHIKQLTLAGYYTSEIGMTVERIYQPVPGRFDGAYPYEQAGTLFTS
ncbi:MAG: gluconate 2-dehydrogenase subunit 3 family protein [Pseudomonadota bacterium]